MGMENTVSPKKAKLDSSNYKSMALVDPHKLWPSLFRPANDAKLLSESYNWKDYLDNPNFSAAPVQAFYHAPLRRVWQHIVPSFKVEVPNRDFWELAEAIGGAYWVASIIKIHGYKVLLRYDGFTDDSSYDFWMNLCSADLHPVGWCAKEGKPLVPPKALAENSPQQTAVNDWKAFLVKKLTGAKTLPVDFQQRVKSAVISKLRVGYTVEAMDRNEMNRYRPGIIKEIKGQRLKIDYLVVDREVKEVVKKLTSTEATPSVHKTLWCQYCSPFVKHVGWCLENNVPLYCNNDYARRCKEKIQTGKYDANDSLAEHFPKVDDSQKSGTDTALVLSEFDTTLNDYFEEQIKFEVGTKLEAIDVYNNFYTITPATVSRIFNHDKKRNSTIMLITYDGTRDSLIVDEKSPFIFPVGYCESHKVDIAKPENYNGGSKFDWKTYLKESNSLGAPAILFQKPEFLNTFKVGQKLEATDSVDPHMVCVATISEVKGRLIRIHYDGWTSSFDQWFDFTSPELYPLGLCELIGHFLEGPSSEGGPELGSSNNSNNNNDGSSSTSSGPQRKYTPRRTSITSSSFQRRDSSASKAKK